MGPTGPRRGGDSPSRRLVRPSLVTTHSSPCRGFRGPLRCHKPLPEQSGLGGWAWVLPTRYTHPGTHPVPIPALYTLAPAPVTRVLALL